MTYILLDTNIYLHCKAFDTLPWNEIIDTTEEVSILLPMQVLRELEQKKDDKSNNTINRRARKVCAKLADLLLNNKDASVSVTMCEMPPKSGFKQGLIMEVADDVILMSAIHFMSTKPGELVVISRDLPMLLKAKQLGLSYVKITDKYVLPSETEDNEKQQLKEELHRLKMRMPVPKVAFEDGSDVVHLKKISQHETVIAEDLTEEERDFCLIQEKAVSTKERFCEIALYVFNEGSAPTDNFTAQLNLNKLKICKISHEIIYSAVPERYQSEEEKNINYDELEEWEDHEPVRQFIIYHKDDNQEDRKKYEAEFDSIIQGLHQPIYYFEIDLYEATSGSIDWELNIPALPDPVRGTLHVVVDQ